MTEAAQANGTTLANGAVRVAAARLDAVSKLYGGFAALRKVTVEFAAGSSTVVLGENGAGKSTLLRLVAGLIAPTRGTVHVFGDEPRWQRRRMAYMSHEAMLYDELTAMENLRYFARLHGGCACGGPEQALRAVGLDPALTRTVGQYSQGMKQRASLARVLQTDPELLAAGRAILEPRRGFGKAHGGAADGVSDVAGEWGCDRARRAGANNYSDDAPGASGRAAGRDDADDAGGNDSVYCWRGARGGAMKVTKTNAARLLDSLGIAYEARAYEVDPEDLSAIAVARKIGLPAEQVFKTLLTRASSGDYFFAVVPGDCELDLKKLAAAAEVKRVELASLKEVEPLTGYVRGGVTVMAARTEFPAYVDETIELFDVVSISAGVRGVQLLMKPADYLRATGATLADLTKIVRSAAGSEAGG